MEPSDHDVDSAGRVPSRREGTQPNNGDDLDDSSLTAGVPSSPILPPPPEIHFERPTLGRARTFDAARPTGNSSAAQTARTQDESRQSNTASAVSVGAGLGAGITFAASVIVGVLVGQWIDHKWFPHSTIPWATMVMTLAGLAAGFINLFKLLSITDRNARRPK